MKTRNCNKNLFVFVSLFLPQCFCVFAFTAAIAVVNVLHERLLNTLKLISSHFILLQQIAAHFITLCGKVNVQQFSRQLKAEGAREEKR